MSDTPARASAVIIGAGIVGNSLAHHLARLGWRDLVLVDKGPMPNPGGSTGHASNFIFPIEYSKMMMELTRDSTEQYQALGVFTQSPAGSRSPAPRSACTSCAAGAPRPRPGASRPSCLTRRGAQARALPGRVGDPGRRELPDGRGGGLAAGRNADAGAGRAVRRPARCWPGPRCSASTPRPAGSCPGCGPCAPARGTSRRDLRDLLRRLEPAHRADGGRADPAHPDRAPDDQRRPGAAVRRHLRRDRLPDRA